MKDIKGMGLECIADKFLSLPNVQKYEIEHKTEYGFTAAIEMDDGYEFKIDICIMAQAYPSSVMRMLEKKDKKNWVLTAPYISERTAELCRQNGIGYFDYAGNCYFVGHSLYMLERGNKNSQPKCEKTVAVFEKSSIVSSLILRKMFNDTKKVWKLKYLADEVGCSIGQVSKVMDYMLKNAFAVKTNDGYRLDDIEETLREWATVYGRKKLPSYSCYSLDNPSVLEEKIKKLKTDTGVSAYLTGLAGGVRYTPVVRYNKVHMFIAPEDIRDAMLYLELKEVESGSNVEIYSMDYDIYKKDYRVIGGVEVVSPIQIYLDCMQIKGRGEEMAEAVMKKEIIK